MSIEDDSKSESPSTSTEDNYVEKVCAMVYGKRCLTVQKVTAIIINVTIRNKPNKGYWYSLPLKMKNICC